MLSDNNDMRLLSTLGILLILPLISCVKKGGFATPACTRGNSNCELPSMQIEIEGGDNSSRAEVGNNGEAGTVEIKSIRYGEKARIEFTLQNPRVLPLRQMVLNIEPGNEAFSVVNSADKKDCTAKDLFLVYKQKCAVTIEYRPKRSPPPSQRLTFTFKTMLGDDFIFKSQFEPAKLLGDFYIEESELTLPPVAVLAPASQPEVWRDIRIENTGTENDLTDIQFFIQGSSEWTIVDNPAPAQACTANMSLAKGGGFCILRIGLAPSLPGLKNASLVLVSGNQVTREYPLKAEAKALSADLQTLDFGVAKVGLGATISRKIELVFPDVEGEALAEQCVYFNPEIASGFEVKTNTCIGKMPQGQPCSVTVDWTPGETSKSYTGEFSWSCDKRGGYGKVQLLARTSGTPLITDKSGLDFGDILVGSTKTLSLKYRNLGIVLGINDEVGTLYDFTRPLEQEPFAELSSNCPKDLKVGVECTVSIGFVPKVAGLYAGSVGGKTIQTAMDYEVSLQGQALSVTPSQNNVDFGMLAVKNDRPGPLIYVRNPSLTETATGCKLDHSSLIAENFSVDSESTCLNKVSLNPEEFCTLKPRFTPGLPNGTRNAMIKYSCDVGGSAEITLTGEVGTENRLVIAPPSRHTLADRLVGTITFVDYLLVNEHPTATASAVSAVPSSLQKGWSDVSLAAASGGCHGANLGPGKACHVRLKSAPSAVAGSEDVGPFVGRLLVSADSGKIDPPDGYFASNNQKLTSVYEIGYNFGVVDLNQEMTSLPITIFNPSSVDPSSSCSEPTVDNPLFSIASSTCRGTPEGGISLTPKGSCRVTVKFNGDSTKRIVEANLDYYCGIGGRARTPLKIAVYPMPRYKWQGDYNFGYLDIDAPALLRSFTLKNDEPFDVELSSLSLKGGSNAFSIHSQTCTSSGSTLKSGDSCEVVVRFDTVEEIGYFSSLSIYGRPVGSTGNPEPSSVNLFGSGSKMRLVISSGSLSFDDKEIGSPITETQTVTITNNGSRPANLSYSLLASPFLKVGSGTCGTVLSEGQSCTVAVQMSAADKVGLSTNTLNIFETSNGVQSSQAIGLSGKTVAIAALVIKDNITNTFATTLNLSDVTGAVGSARNIVDKSESRTVTYTVTNNVAESGRVRLGELTFAHKAGVNGTMNITSNSCEGASLAANASCEITVTYTPTEDRQTSTYILTLAGSSVANGVLPIQVTNVVGNSYKSSTLTLSASSIDFGAVAKGSVVAIKEIAITNSGDFAVDLSTMQFSGEGHSDLTVLPGTTSPHCGESLAAGVTCYLNIKLIPTQVRSFVNVGTVNASYKVGLNAITQNLAMTIRAVSYVQLASAGFGSNVTGEEAEIAADATRVYVATRQTNFTDFGVPVITICERHSDGYVSNDTSLCQQNILKDGMTDNKLSGTLNGAGPKIAVTNNFIFLAVNNQDPFYDDDTLDTENRNLHGNTTVIVCKKPGADRVISLVSDCAVVPINFQGNLFSTGAFPGLAVAGSRIALSNTISGNDSPAKGIIIHVCSFNDAPSVAPANVIDKDSCKGVLKDFGNAERSQMGAIDFNGSQLVMAYYNALVGEESLNALSCNVATDNQLTCGDSTLITNELLDTTTPQPVAPGAYPSVVIDNSKIYFAHQQGENYRRYLRLSDCSLGSANNTVISGCSTQTAVARSGSSGLGMLPRLSKVGTGATAKLWLSYIGSNLGDAGGSQLFSAVRSCALQVNGSPICSGSAYFDLSNNYTVSNTYFPARGHFIDSLKNIMIIPQATGSNRKVGTVSLGLPAGL